MQGEADLPKQLGLVLPWHVGCRLCPPPSRAVCVPRSMPALFLLRRLLFHELFASLPEFLVGVSKDLQQ